MRDLKHLIFMEDLLQEANNDLVKQAKAEGRRALGYTCNFMPEVLLDLAGCFSVRLRAPRSGSPDMATYYMSARTCHFGPWRAGSTSWMPRWPPRRAPSPAGSRST